MDPRQLNPNEGRKLNRPTKVQDRAQGGVVDAMAVVERRGMEAAEAGLRKRPRQSETKRLIEAQQL